MIHDAIDRFRSAGQWATLAAISLVGFVALAITSGGNLLLGHPRYTFLLYMTVPIVIGLAQMSVLAVGQLNLAVGGLGGMLAVLMGVLMVDHGWSAWLAVAVGLIGGAAIGALTGAIVVVTKVNGFIITLASLTILSGLQYRLVGTRTIDSYSPRMVELGEASVLNVPYIFLLAIGVAILVAWFFRSTLVGRRLLASGGSPVAARLSGISEERSIVIAHALSGLLVGVAAIITLAVTPGVNRSIGADWLLPSFAAPIIGGVPLAGGAVAVAGTVFATFIVRLVDTARAELSLDTSWVNFVIGAVMLVTVVLSTRSQRAAARQVVTGSIGNRPSEEVPDG